MTSPFSRPSEFQGSKASGSSRPSEFRGTKTSRFPIDGHVHFYRHHDLGKLLEAVRRSPAFRAGSNGEPGFGLCLTEDARHSCFEELRSGARQIPGWSAVPLAERGSLLLCRGGATEAESLADSGAVKERTEAVSSGEAILVSSGFQTVSAEGLEVLSLFSTHRPADGRSLIDTVREIHEHNAVAVLPWAFGKWWGRRGRVLQTLLEDRSRPPVAIGDNFGRAAGLPGLEPREVARRFGLLFLPGSDPLPLPGREMRAGRYGFYLQSPANWDAPGADLVQQLRQLQSGDSAAGPEDEESQPKELEVFGQRTNWADFARDQVDLRLGKKP